MAPFSGHPAEPFRGTFLRAFGDPFRALFGAPFATLFGAFRGPTESDYTPLDMNAPSKVI